MSFASGSKVGERTEGENRGAAAGGPRGDRNPRAKSELLTKTRNVRLLLDNAFTMAETAQMHEARRDYAKAHAFYVGCAGGFLQAIPLVRDDVLS